jgi:sulfite reductase alpha subunit-like flavoprotein
MDSKAQIHQINHSMLLPGVATIFDVCSFLDIPSISLTTLPDPSVLLKSRKSSSGCIEILSTVDEVDLSEDFPLRENGVYTTSKPYRANVLEASWLTKHDEKGESYWGEHHDVIRLELGISGSGIQYQPGDYLSIVVPNPSRCVDVVMERLRMSLTLSLSKPSCEFLNSIPPSSICGDTFIRKNGEVLRLQEFLQYRCVCTIMRCFVCII